MKKSLRHGFELRRQGLSAAERMEYDAAVRQAVRESRLYRSCRCVTLFATDGTEPDLLPLMDDEGMTFALPRYVPERKCYQWAVVRDRSRELVCGRYGLPEPDGKCPVLPDETAVTGTLHLVPGVAFDLRGVRLGRGGGFYDRLLNGVESPVWGVFYSCQQSAEPLPEEEHDRRLDGVFTELDVLDFRT